MSGRSIPDGVQLSPGAYELLVEAKELAASSGEPVEVRFGGQCFDVQARGQGKYPVVLRHDYGLVKLTDSDRIPTVRVEPLAVFLHAVGPAAAFEWFRSVVEDDFGGDLCWSTSRIDLFADVHGWVPQPEDRERLVGRARSRVLRFDDLTLTGIELGRRSSKTISCRIYDKTVEVFVLGHDHWYEIWGDRFDPTLPVWRIEFELHSKALRELGHTEPLDVLDAVGGLWAHATEEWLRLAVPVDDINKSRWPTDPAWHAIQQASLRGDAVSLDRLRTAKSTGDVRRLMPGLAGFLTSFAAATGCDTYDDAVDELVARMEDYEYQHGRTFEGRVASKRRDY